MHQRELVWWLSRQHFSKIIIPPLARVTPPSILAIISPISIDIDPIMDLFLEGEWAKDPGDVLHIEHLFSQFV